MSHEQSEEHTKTEFSMLTNDIYGILFPPFVQKKRIDELKDWIPFPDDVYVVNYPKSGSTWLRHIVKLIKNNGIDDGVDILKSVRWLEADPDLEACKVPSTLLKLTVRTIVGPVTCKTPRPLLGGRVVFIW